MTERSSVDPFRYPGIADPGEWTIASVVRWQAAHHPDRSAIEFIGRENWTFADCERVARITAAQLSECGILKGANVAVFADDPQVFCACWLGLTELGAVMVAINTGLRGESLRHQLGLAAVSHVLTDRALQEVVANVSKLPVAVITGAKPQTPVAVNRVSHDPRHSDTACIMFTSGTSGPSKGVVMPEAHCMLFAVGTIENLGLRAEDRFYICLPLFHANGLFMQLLACLVAGATACIRARFSASRWLDDIRQHRITHTNMLGAIAAFVTAQPASDVDQEHCLRVISAAPLPAEPERIFRERFGVASVVPLYGMTEVNIPLYGDLNTSAPGTAGKVYSRYFEVQIRDPDTDEPVADGNIGEIMVRPRQAFGFMSSYIAQSDKTLEAWRNFWFHTGDAGFRRPDGYFVFVDRIKDCIRRRGENISSYEVEQAFLSLGQVTEAAAFAVPADGGEGMEDEVMVALLMASDCQSLHQTDLALMIESVRKDLPVYAVPRYLLVVDDLPKTPTGKIRKSVLREQGVTDATWDLETWPNV